MTTSAAAAALPDPCNKVAERCTYLPGDSCDVPAGTTHEEHTEADGVRYLAGRRPAAQNATAAE
jgi:hypothetical protein